MNDEMTKIHFVYNSQKIFSRNRF